MMSKSFSNSLGPSPRCYHIKSEIFQRTLRPSPMKAILLAIISLSIGSAENLARLSIMHRRPLLQGKPGMAISWTPVYSRALVARSCTQQVCGSTIISYPANLGAVCCPEEDTCCGAVSDGSIACYDSDTFCCGEGACQEGEFCCGNGFGCCPEEFGGDCCS
jgi:hypothetical protein